MKVEGEIEGWREGKEEASREKKLYEDSTQLMELKWECRL